MVSPELRRPFHSFSMCQPLARLCQTAGEVRVRGPRPGRLRIGGDDDAMIPLAQPDRYSRRVRECWPLCIRGVVEKIPGDCRVAHRRVDGVVRRGGKTGHVRRDRITFHEGGCDYVRWPAEAIRRRAAFPLTLVSRRPPIPSGE